MITLPGYKIETEIHTGEKSIVYRAKKGDKSVVLKYLNSEYPTNVEVDSFKREFDILCKLNLPLIVKVETLEKFKNSPVIVFEDIGGKSLNDILLEKKKFDVKEFLKIGILSVEALASLHRLHIVHKDIKPHNIIYNQDSERLQFIDFGIATILNRENPTISLKNNLEGTLSYISPEQTGRMNRPLDYRTDFYSLGISFYQLLTGELPFHSDDPAELVHSHIAKSPLAPQEKGVPRVISEIIMKLLEKNPEDRYQSAEGILHDLIEFQKRLNIPLSGVPLLGDVIQSINFEIGKNDISSRFQIPDRLYGRDEELSMLHNGFSKAIEGNLVSILVSGHSGIGKTALINEIQKPLAKYKGFFISGKFDKYKQDTPNYAITQAFRDFCDQLMAQTESVLLLYKNEITKSVGINGKVITDVIPQLEGIIGEQSDVAELSLGDSQNRLNLVLQDFIQALCTEAHPLVLFLDDLQWADSSSLNFLKTILTTGNIKYLYIILSYRSNEVDTTHPFSILIEDTKKQGLEYEQIFLKSITESDVNRLTADTLHANKEEVEQLSKIIYSKTEGNPFFVTELLRSLYQDDLIFFEQNWKWDIEKIKAVSISDNVLEHMRSRLQLLAPEKQDILKLAACIGNWLRKDVFVKISGVSSQEVEEKFADIANEGYVSIGGNEIRFAHDKVREAMYTFISDEDKARNHYKIGKTYLALCDEGAEDINALIFTVVAQLNQGSTIMSEQEKSRLLELNLQAGKKAMSSSAYESALDFLNKAKDLLPEDSWNKNYDLASSLYFSLSEAEYVNTHFDKAEELFEYIFKNVKTNLEKVQINKVRIPLYFGANRLKQALQTSLESLKLLNIDLPENPPEEVLYAEINEANENLKGYSIPSLLNLPVAIDKEVLALHEDLAEKVTLVYVAAPQLTPIIILKLVNSSIKSGNSPVSTFGYTMFGMLKISVFGDFKAGLELGKLGLDLLDKYDSLRVSSRVLFFYATTIAHWVEHAKKAQEIFRRAIDNGRATGDLQFPSYSCNYLCLQSFLIREPLNELTVKMDNYLQLLKKMKVGDAMEFFAYFHQLSHNLYNDNINGNLELMIGDYCNEEESIPKLRAANNLTILAIAFIAKSIAAYLFKNYTNAFNFSKESEAYLGGVFGMMVVPERNFIYSLSCLALYESETSLEKKQEYLEQVRKNQENMKVWGENCPANYGHKYYLIEAELASSILELSDKNNLDENKANIINLFDKAIELAKENTYLFEEALANEFLAKFWNKIGKESYANTHIEAAYYAYKLWGCKPRIAHLEDKYPMLLKRQLGRTVNTNMTTSLSGQTTSIGATATGSSSFLDLNTVVKASQTISGEIQLGKLLEKMMKILFENAGAERGFFILKEKDKFYVEAEGNANTETISVLQTKPVEGNPDLSPGMVNYVVRTKGIVLLNDAVKKGMFVNDVYVKAKQPKSVLCYPIINQGNLVGVIYLENNLTTDAFTPDRVEILKILSSQIAVSVENSLLYANLEEKVEERTRDLNQALVEVRGLKEQQDGDYFLNTLLIEPLGQNNAFSKQVGIEFFIKQKKNFIFRRKEYELGGDINISENIELQGKKYIVFLNGDAMGKSIQGAGGVIVLGTVFKSILQRTISTSAGKNVYPERWIKNAFIEMHKAFESFDGSMLMSIVFGLIDEITGTMYFMNAEHPDIVLYRDGIPSFIENPNQYRKLGTQGQTGNICVEVLSLRPDDVIILGSDGRDDIILGKDSETGSDIINQDEHLFLTHVKKADGDLERIYEEIKNAGKQMDDISLLKIHYKGITADQEKLDQDLKLLEDYKELGKYKEYAEVGSKVISNYPHLTNFLLEMSHAYKELGQYEKAIDFGERLRLRDAKNTVNLLNLVESYKGLGKKERAKAILDACLKARPEDERFLKLKEEF